MNIYEFYEAEFKKPSDAKEATEEAETKENTEQTPIDSLEKLFTNSLKEMYYWSMQITENMPNETYDFLRDFISSDSIDPELIIEIQTPNLISLKIPKISYYFITQNAFSSSNYAEFKEKTNCKLAIIIFPEDPCIIQVQILSKDDSFHYEEHMEKKSLMEILQKLYGKENVNIDGQLWSVNIDTTSF